MRSPWTSPLALVALAARLVLRHHRQVIPICCSRMLWVTLCAAHHTDALRVHLSQPLGEPRPLAWRVRVARGARAGTIPVQAVQAGLARRVVNPAARYSNEDGARIVLKVAVAVAVSMLLTPVKMAGKAGLRKHHLFLCLVRV